MQTASGDQAPAVLVVDLDDSQRHRLRDLLEGHGVAVIEARRLEDGMRAIGVDGTHLHGAVIDGRLPLAALHALVTEVERRWPLAVVVVEMPDGLPDQPDPLPPALPVAAGPPPPRAGRAHGP